jgi:hypothetical protein
MKKHWSTGFPPGALEGRGAGTTCRRVVPRALAAVVVFCVPVLLHAAEVARPADSFVESVGVNTHLGYTDTIYREFDNIIKPRLRELGVRHIRDGTWNSNVLARYRELHQGGIRVLLISNSKRAVEQAAALGPALWAIEGVNEPDHGEGWEVKARAEQQALFKAIKGGAATAKVPVVVSSLANIRNSPGKLGDLTAFLDFGNMHPYAAGQMPTKHWGWGLDGDTALAEARKVSTTRSIVITECGYHNKTDNKDHPGATEAAAGKYIPRLLLHYFERGFVRSYLYELADEKPDAELKDKEQHFGLIRRDGSVKPAFTAVKNLLAILNDPGPVFQPKPLEFSLGGDTNNVRHLLFQKRNGRFALVLWREVSSYDLKERRDLNPPPGTITVSLEQNFREATLHQPGLGPQRSKTFPPGNDITLGVPDQVIVLELKP